MTHNQVSIGLLYSTFPLTTITFCHVSPNPMAVPKLFLQDLKRRTKTTFRKKSRKIKIFVLEIATFFSSVWHAVCQNCIWSPRKLTWSPIPFVFKHQTVQCILDLQSSQWTSQGIGLGLGLGLGPVTCSSSFVFFFLYFSRLSLLTWCPYAILSSVTNGVPYEQTPSNPPCMPAQHCKSKASQILVSMQP